MSSLSPFINRSLFDELFRDVSPAYYIKPLHGDPLPTQIKLDLRETPNEFIVEAEVPGADKNNIHVSIDGNIVNIRAQIDQLDTENKADKLLRSERYFGEISRSFQLSSDIDEVASKARYENGVLTLSLVKKQKQGGQRMVIE